MRGRFIKLCSFMVTLVMILSSYLSMTPSAEYVIFTNGSTQTVDVAYPGGEKKYYTADTTSDGKYKVLEW